MAHRGDAPASAQKGDTTMVRAANLGFPRIGPNRELKFATEKYWQHELGVSSEYV